MLIKPVYRFAALAALFFTASVSSSVAASTGTCTEITTIPATISVQGVYCLQSDKATAAATGTMITIATNNVTIDLNGFKLANLAAGATTQAIGIAAQDRQNITIRNGNIRGFARGVFLMGTNSSGHLVEDLLLDKNVSVGVAVEGSGNIVRNNRVINTGPGVPVAPTVMINGGPVDVNTHTIGILVQTGSDTVVSGNVVAGVSSASHAAGIFLNGAAIVEVRSNSVLDTTGTGDKLAIEIHSGADVNLIANRILNATGTGDTGLGAFGSSGINCIENIVFGFATVEDVCNFEFGTIPSVGNGAAQQSGFGNKSPAR